MRNADLTEDWVLHLDADEVATSEMLDEVEFALRGAPSHVNAFKLCRKTMFMGRWLKYSDGFPVWIMRLVRKDIVEFEDCGHGEVAVPVVPGLMGTIQEPFLHFAFSKGLANWIERP